MEATILSWKMFDKVAVCKNMNIFNKATNVERLPRTNGVSMFR
jgi:hypothetical protein